MSDVVVALLVSVFFRQPVVSLFCPLHSLLPVRHESRQSLEFEVREFSRGAQAPITLMGFEVYIIDPCAFRFFRHIGLSVD